jgi:photosystem II stability/assembly factor-like uncharacterized protein
VLSLDVTQQVLAPYSQWYRGRLERSLAAGGSFRADRAAVKAMLIFGSLAGSLWLSANLVSRVVLLSQLRLVGLDVQFLDPSSGFALAALDAGAGSETVALFKTADGGQNWARVFTNDPNDASGNNSLPRGGQKYGFTFLDASRGWVGGATPVDNTIYLYRTLDGGATWSETGLALPAGYESAQTGNYGPQFFSASEGILVVNLAMPADPGLVTLVYRTTDGGETWTPGQVIAGGRPADFFSFHEGVAWGNGNQFNVTRDAGQTWGALVPNQDFSASLVSFQFVNPLVGWALTTNEVQDPSLFKTTDGGATWSLIVP